MAKYKVGDKVIVKKDIKSNEHYGMDGEDELCRATTEMANKAGSVVTISKAEYVGRHFRYRIKEDGWFWVDGMFEGLANTNKIVITTDGKTTTARLFNGKEMVKKAEAKCSPDDTFDFMVGAKLAMERLDPKPANPFKVGDYVRITGNKTFCHGLPVGSVGRVTKVDTEDCMVDGFWDHGSGRIEQHVGIEELEKI